MRLTRTSQAATVHVHQPAAETHRLDLHLGRDQVVSRATRFGLFPDLAIFEGDPGLAVPAVEFAGDGSIRSVRDRPRWRRRPCVPSLCRIGAPMSLTPLAWIHPFRNFSCSGAELVQARRRELILRHAFLERWRLKSVPGRRRRSRRERKMANRKPLEGMTVGSVRWSKRDQLDENSLLNGRLTGALRDLGG